MRLRVPDIYRDETLGTALAAWLAIIPVMPLVIPTMGIMLLMGPAAFMNLPKPPLLACFTVTPANRM